MNFGGYVFIDDAESSETEQPSKSTPRKTGLAYRRLMRKHKDKRLRKIVTLRSYNPARGYVDWDFVNGDWQPVGKYVKYMKNSNTQKYLKRRSNRIVRRSDIPLKGNGYRKCFDYWWFMS